MSIWKILRTEFDAVIQSLVMMLELPNRAFVHVREAKPILNTVARGVFAVGALIIIEGFLLIHSGAKGRTTIQFLTLKFQSTSVGIAAIFIGAAMIVIVLTKLMKRVKELAALPPEQADQSDQLQRR